MAAQPPTPARAPGADTVRLPRGCIPGLGQPDEEQVTTSTATDWSVVREKGFPVGVVYRARGPALGSWEDRPPAA
eukprot:1184796-Prorocentrum_minimum.AAC.1